MQFLIPALVYPSFFGLIGYVCFLTGSPWPLLALVFMPSWRQDKDKNDEQSTEL